MPSPFNRYQDYEAETNSDAYEYEKRCFEEEEEYRKAIDEEIERYYFGNMGE